MAKTRTVVVKAKGKPGVWTLDIYRGGEVLIWDGDRNITVKWCHRGRDAQRSAVRLSKKLNLPYLGRQTAA